MCKYAISVCQVLFLFFEFNVEEITTVVILNQWCDLFVWASVQALQVFFQLAWIATFIKGKPEKKTNWSHSHKEDRPHCSSHNIIMKYILSAITLQVD